MKNFPILDHGKESFVTLVATWSFIGHFDDVSEKKGEELAIGNVVSVDQQTRETLSTQPEGAATATLGHAASENKRGGNSHKYQYAFFCLFMFLNLYTNFECLSIFLCTYSDPLSSPLISAQKCTIKWPYIKSVFNLHTQFAVCSFFCAHTVHF
jgi:hypothetical protein